jgi:hypothetical protein
VVVVVVPVRLAVTQTPAMQAARAAAGSVHPSPALPYSGLVAAAAVLDSTKQPTMPGELLPVVAALVAVRQTCPQREPLTREVAVVAASIPSQATSQEEKLELSAAQGSSLSDTRLHPHPASSQCSEKSKGEKLKHLTVTYNDHTLFDGEVNELVWADSDSGIKIEGRIKKAGNNSGGLLDMLANASKNRTAEMVADKRQQLETEKVEVAAEV